MQYFQIVLLVATFGFAQSKELPPFLHVCQRSDQYLTNCIIASIEDLRPYFIKGVPEYNIPSLEPLVMNDFFEDDAAGMKIIVSNVTAYGCSDYFVRDMTVDMDSLQFVVDVEIPKLRIEASYSVDGKLLLVPVKGEGSLETNITDVYTRVVLQGELHDVDGVTYMRYKDVTLKVQVGGGNARLERLFNGDKVLLSMLNDVVNRNLDVFLSELMPIIENALGGVIKKSGNGIVDAYPFDVLFPFQ